MLVGHADALTKIMKKGDDDVLPPNGLLADLAASVFNAIRSSCCCSCSCATQPDRPQKNFLDWWCHLLPFFATPPPPPSPHFLRLEMTFQVWQEATFIPALPALFFFLYFRLSSVLFSGQERRKCGNAHPTKKRATTVFKKYFLKYFFPLSFPVTVNELILLASCSKTSSPHLHVWGTASGNFFLGC